MYAYMYTPEKPILFLLPLRIYTVLFYTVQLCNKTPNRSHTSPCSVCHHGLICELGVLVKTQNKSREVDYQREPVQSTRKRPQVPGDSENGVPPPTNLKRVINYF